MFGPIGHVVLQDGPKMNDAKPVFSTSPIVLQPAIVPVSSQRCEVRSNMYRAKTCAHSGIEPSTFAKGFLQGGPKIRIFDHF